MVNEFTQGPELDEGMNDLWRQEIKDFENKGGFAALNKSKTVLEYKQVKPTVTLTLTSIDDVLDYDPPQYLIDPILVEGTVNLFRGGGGKGKSIITLAGPVKSVLTGDPLWGKFPVNRTGPVLIVDEETPRPFLKDRTQKVGFDKNLPLYFLHFQDIRLDNDQVFEALMWEIVKVNPVLIVFDSLVRIHRQQENDSVSMSVVMAKFRKIANCGPAVWVIHHDKKGEGPLEDKARGSTDIVAGVDIEYSLVSKNNCLHFSSVKTRVEPFGPIQLKIEVSKDRLDVVYQGDEKENALKEVLDILDGESLKAGDIHEKLKGRGVDIGINRVRDILKSSPEITGTKISRRGGGILYSLNQVLPLEGKFHSSPLSIEGVKQCNLNLNLHGHPENSHTPREAIVLDSQDLAEVSRVENEGGSETIKPCFEVSRGCQENQRASETSGEDDSIRQPGEEG